MEHSNFPTNTDLRFFSLYTDGENLAMVEISRLQYILLGYASSQYVEFETSEGNYYAVIKEIEDNSEHQRIDITLEEYNDRGKVQLDWQPKKPQWLGAEWEYAGESISRADVPEAITRNGVELQILTPQ